MKFKTTVMALILLGATAKAELPYTLTEKAKIAVAVVQSPSFDSHTCPKILSDFQKDVAAINWNDYSNKTLHSQAQGSIQKFWQWRLALHQKLNLVGDDCIPQIRDLFHRLREHEDYLSEFASAAPVYHPENVNFFQEPTPFWERTEDYATTFVRSDLSTPLQLRSGDVLLARGTSFVSAIIARMSDNVSGFSHAILWNVDAKTKAQNSVESYLDVGVQEFEAEYSLRNENVRLAVLRPKDAALGARAAAAAMRAADKKTPYDYKLNYKDPSAMSCVEVVTASYEQASGGTLSFPMYPGKLAVKDPVLVSHIGITGTEMIEPADLETDPRFELIADWRDNRIIRDSRHKDAILSEILRWVDQLGYDFNGTATSFFVQYILQPTRNTPLWPVMNRLTGININSGMPRSTLGVVVVLNQVSEKLLEEIRRLDAEYLEKYSRPMTNAQLRAALEKFRVEDLRRYNNNEHSVFHHMMNPYSTHR